VIEYDGLDVGIVSYRSRELLRDCLEFLRDNAPRRPMRVVVVDNDSRDGTVELVRGFPQVELIEAPRNLGFAAAMNEAIRTTAGRYFLALNPDTRVQPAVLDSLLGLMDEDPRVGICGCRLERENGSFDHAARRSFPTPLGALAHFTGIGRRANVPRCLAQYRAPHVERGPVDAVSGAFMLIRRQALETVGLFDEGYWLYMEDLDLCYRFSQAGWITWYEPSVAVTHFKGGTTGRWRTLRVNRAFHSGMIRFYRRHYARSHPRLFNAVIYGAIAAKFTGSAVRSTFNRRLLGRA
jgi:GT2 family glycosyltransferase